MKRGRPSGWQITSRTKQPALSRNGWVPTLWDLMLVEYKLTPSSATSSKQAQRWVRENYRRAYVPEVVLEAMGIDVNLEWGDA